MTIHPDWYFCLVIRVVTTHWQSLVIWVKLTRLWGPFHGLGLGPIPWHWSGLFGSDVDGPIEMGAIISGQAPREKREWKGCGKEEYWEIPFVWASLACVDNDYNFQIIRFCSTNLVSTYQNYLPLRAICYENYISLWTLPLWSETVGTIKSQMNAWSLLYPWIGGWNLVKIFFTSYIFFSTFFKVCQNLIFTVWLIKSSLYLSIAPMFLLPSVNNYYSWYCLRVCFGIADYVIFNDIAKIILFKLGKWW